MKEQPRVHWQPMHSSECFLNYCFDLHGMSTVQPGSASKAAPIDSGRMQRHSYCQAGSELHSATCWKARQAVSCSMALDFGL